MNTTVWLITFTDSNGKRAQTVHAHNCVADFRVTDQNATAQEIDCAAVAELIEADKGYDAAREAHGETYHSGGMVERSATHHALEAAKKRRDTALARVGGAS